MTPDHDLLRDDLGLYALGVLDPEARAAVEGHLAMCETCRGELECLTPVVEALALTVPSLQPPAALRSRVLSSVAPPQAPANQALSGTPSRAPRWAWLVAAAAVALCVGLGTYAATLQARIENLSNRLADAERLLQAARGDMVEARRALDAAQSDVRVLLSPDVTRVVLSGEGSTPAATGRAYYSPAEGLLFTASNLRPLPETQVYQLWLVTAAAPVSAGLIPLPASGTSTVLLPSPAGAGVPVAFAVTIEPAGGVPAPTGERVLLGLVAAS
ncbi:MAG: anti-sigma factor [Vicinamibacterales bacterium]